MRFATAADCIGYGTRAVVRVVGIRLVVIFRLLFGGGFEIRVIGDSDLDGPLLLRMTDLSGPKNRYRRLYVIPGLVEWVGALVRSSIW